MQEKKSVIIVGSGLGGLSAGALLAKQGFKVTVIEKHFQYGGYATMFKRRGSNGKIINFDVSLHGIGNLSKDRNQYKIFDKIGLFDKIEVLRKKETATIVKKNSEVDIYDSWDKYLEDSIERYPEEADGIRALFGFLKDLDHDMEINAYRDKKIPKFYDELSNISIYDFVKKYVNNEEFIYDFCFLWLYYGLQPKQLNALYYCLAWIGYHIGGTYYIKGGGGALSDALVSIIEENNGILIKNEEIETIIENNGKIDKVISKKGKEYYADIYILNGCPIPLVERMNDSDLKKQELENFYRLNPSISLTQLYIGLDDNPEKYGLNKADYFFENTDPDFGFSSIENGDYKTTPMAIVNYNLMDPDLNKDCGFIAITIGDYMKLWPEDKEEYIKQKKFVTNVLCERLYEKFPQVKGHIIALELGTPRTMQRYTDNIGGAVYGFEQSLDGSGYSRPYIKSSFENLYYASAWTQPGGGYEGALRSGIMCSDLIINSKSKNVSNTSKPNDQMISSLYIKGMIAQANKEAAKNVKGIIELYFKDENEHYYVKVDNGKITLVKDTESNVKIICDYKIWKDIGDGNIRGEDAFRRKDLIVEGDLELFSHVPKIFSSNHLTTPEQRHKLIPYASLWIFLTLVPWIFFWILQNYLDPLLISGFAFGWLALLQLFGKPKVMKKNMQLESITLLSFAIYLLWYYFDIYTFNQYGHCISFLLPILLLLFLPIRSMCEEYTVYAYPKIMTDTILFKIINRKITIVWIMVFFIQSIFVDVIFYGYYWNPIFYSFELIGIIFSIVYPKIVLK